MKMDKIKRLGSYALALGVGLAGGLFYANNSRNIGATSPTDLEFKIIPEPDITVFNEDFQVMLRLSYPEIIERYGEGDAKLLLESILYDFHAELL